MTQSISTNLLIQTMMLDLEKLEGVDKEHIYLSLKHYLDKRHIELVRDYENIREGIKLRPLKNLEEVIGKLIMISIDPDNPDLGYCLIDLGDDLYNIEIENPGEVFQEWDRKSGIVFYESVGILRMDEQIKTAYHLRYISEEMDENNISVTKNILAEMQVIDPEEYWKVIVQKAENINKNDMKKDFLDES